METKLYEAAKEGSVTSLINLLQEDELVLDRCIVTSSGDTPLHIAAMLGHAEFCFELLRRKPELAGELDSRRSSALHLASAKGYTEIAKTLANINPHMCLICDRDGRNPLHVAVIRGKVAVLKELLQAQPDAPRARVDRGETILHLCVQHFQVEALKLLIEVIDDQEFLNAKDNNGNTILHLAVSEKQIEIINFLLENTVIEVNYPNAYGFTEMDILAQSRRDIKDLDIAECLQDAGGLKSKDLPQKQPKFESRKARKRTPPSNSNGKSCKISLSSSDGRNSWGNYFDKQEAWLEKQRDSLMVVASLIATMVFQAGVNPPCGVWQENSDADSQGNSAHIAGTSILSDQNPTQFQKFLCSNTVAFVSSLSIILLLMSGLPLKRRVFMWILVLIMWAAITSTAFVYLISVAAFTTRSNYALLQKCLVLVILVWLGLMAILLVCHTIRVVMIVVKKSKRLLRRQRHSDASMSISMNSSNVLCFVSTTATYMSFGTFHWQS